MCTDKASITQSLLKFHRLLCCWLHISTEALSLVTTPTPPHSSPDCNFIDKVERYARMGSSSTPTKGSHIQLPTNSILYICVGVIYWINRFKTPFQPLPESDLFELCLSTQELYLLMAWSQRLPQMSANNVSCAIVGIGLHRTKRNGKNTHCIRGATPNVIYIWLNEGFRAQVSKWKCRPTQVWEYRRW